MASITVRNLEEELKRRLRLQRGRTDQSPENWMNTDLRSASRAHTDARTAFHHLLS